MIFKNKIVFALFILLIILVLVARNLTWESSGNKLTIVKISLEDCKPQKQVCNVELSGLNVRILFDKDVFYLKPFNVTVWTEGNVEVESVHIDFKMKNMNMGVNRFLLTEVGNKKQSWQGKALLPICVTRRADWFSELEIVIDKKKYILTFPLIVKQATS